MQVRLAAALVHVSIGALSSAAGAAQCDFSHWQDYKGTALYKADDATTYFWITSRAAVDADGAPNAYHPEDVGKPCGATGAGLDCPANAGYPNTSWWPSVLAADLQSPGVAFVAPSGFFVSMTALDDRDNTNPRDPARYVDATTIPYVVFPGNFFELSGTGLMGDVGVAYHLTTKKLTAFIVGDRGPSDEALGEGSIALFEALGGTNPNPRTGSGIAAGKVLYLTFPRSVLSRPDVWPLSPVQLDQLAEDLLASAGGKDTLIACADEFS